MFIVQASGSDRQSLALSVDGDIYQWGKGEYSQAASQALIPQLMDAVKPTALQVFDRQNNQCKFILITSGVSHHAAIDQFGKLYTWGNCADGCLGHQGESDLFAPSLVEAFEHQKIVDIGCGDRFTVLLTIDQGIPYNCSQMEAFKSNLTQKAVDCVKVMRDFRDKKLQVRELQRQSFRDMSDVSQITNPPNKLAGLRSSVHSNDSLQNCDSSRLQHQSSLYGGSPKKSGLGNIDHSKQTGIIYSGKNPLIENHLSIIYNFSENSPKQQISDQFDNQLLNDKVITQASSLNNPLRESDVGKVCKTERSKLGLPGSRSVVLPHLNLSSVSTKQDPVQLRNCPSSDHTKNIATTGTPQPLLWSQQQQELFERYNKN